MYSFAFLVFIGSPVYVYLFKFQHLYLHVSDSFDVGQIFSDIHGNYVAPKVVILANYWTLHKQLFLSLVRTPFKLTLFT